MSLNSRKTSNLEAQLRASNQAAHTPTLELDRSGGVGRRSILVGAIKKLSLIFVSILSGLVILEILSRALFADWGAYDASRFLYSEFLDGYGEITIGRPGFDGSFAQNDGDFHISVKINQSGYRQIDAIDQAHDRLWFVGDSFTFGWGVETVARYSELVGALLQAPIYNIASPGTDVCGYQWQIARMPADVKPAAVVVGIYIENDLAYYDCPKGRLKMQPKPHKADGGGAGIQWGALKPLMTHYSAFYNVLAVTLKKSPLIVNALINLGIVNMPHAQVFHADQVSNDVLRKTADEIAYLRSMVDPKTPFVVLIIPSRLDIRDQSTADATVRENLIQMIQARGIHTVDPSKELIAASFKAVHFHHDGHWSPLGHSIAAKKIIQRLHYDGDRFNVVGPMPSE